MTATPKERPTEWTAAVVMLSVALFAFTSDHDTAALIATVGACLPAIVTALVAYARRRSPLVDELADAIDGDDVEA